MCYRWPSSLATDARTRGKAMARYSGAGEPGMHDDEVIYIQRPLPPADEGFHRRLWGFMIIMAISFCLLLGRTWQLQVMQGDYFLRLSEQNRLRSLRTKSLRSEEHTSELQSRGHLVCRLLLEKKKKTRYHIYTSDENSKYQ